jgi:hypothetical protein
MTAPDNVTFIKAANTLKRRAERGRGATIEDMLQAADRVLTSHSEAGREKLRAAIADALAAIDRWREGGRRTALVATLAAIVRESESQGEVLGLRMLVEVSARLAAFMSLFEKCDGNARDEKVALAIVHHLDAMIIAIDGNPKEVVDERSRNLLRNLELTRRTIKLR